nr:hypothetical protein Iba_scaffold1583812CG0010 [Ipomoea batatas]
MKLYTLHISHTPSLFPLSSFQLTPFLVGHHRCQLKIHDSLSNEHCHNADSYILQHHVCYSPLAAQNKVHPCFHFLLPISQIAHLSAHCCGSKQTHHLGTLFLDLFLDLFLSGNSSP